MSSGVAYVADSVAALSFAPDYSTHTEVAQPGCNSAGDRKAAAGWSEQSRARTAIDTNASAEKVLRSFNTWAFKREQPSDPQLMVQIIADAIAAKQPVPFLLYWGKGPRHESAAPDQQCLDFLAALAARVSAAYAPGAALKLILTDTHAELNGHRREDICKYFDHIKAAAAQRGFETCWLGPLVKAAGSLAAAAPVDEAVPAETLSRLIASAHKWYHGPGTPQDGALTYLRMNLIEQRVVERAFPRSIFITFNGSGLRSLFPRQLPIFYMYSLRRGMSVKPWFLSAESARFDLSADRTNPQLSN